MIVLPPASHEYLSSQRVFTLRLLTPVRDSSRSSHISVLFLQEQKSSGRSSMSRCRNSVATTTSDDQPHIGNYRLLKTIGKGNFAKVKLARHVLTGKEVSMHTHQIRLERGFVIESIKRRVFGVLWCFWTFLPAADGCQCLNGGGGFVTVEQS